MRRKFDGSEEHQRVIQAQNQTGHFDKTDTEFSLEESVQEAIAKSQAYQAQNQQPTYEPNKPF
ncbi:hypothetical protein [Bacillus sp. S/N-304-OC-R1]|uniref:hypothetical protein n=1 Tax=Bacillus sp. S/N-304-OC-R1 TaxID=2758034 RepID=UPI001C8E4525|nr:hypothetical protein [Bacillus sp. S/N-304-OC-R1]MBY0123352.1 hypothetical protein [Bacillus sp. S/N-304-OC-R1]